MLEQELSSGETMNQLINLSDRSLKSIRFDCRVNKILNFKYLLLEGVKYNRRRETKLWIKHKVKNMIIYIKVFGVIWFQ